jgi:excisionase family DNA binding protein
MNAETTVRWDARNMAKSHPLPAHFRPSRFWTISDIAQRLSVSTKTVSRWIRKGELLVHRFGRAVRIAEEDFQAFLNARRLCRED